MLAPSIIARCLVGHTCHELILLRRCLIHWNAQLMLQLSNDGSPDTSLSLHLPLTVLCIVQWVGAARIGPIQWKSDFFGGTLLQQEFTLLVEHENGEGTVQGGNAWIGDVTHQVTVFLGGKSLLLVILVHDDTELLFHEGQLDLVHVGCR